MVWEGWKHVMTHNTTAVFVEVKHFDILTICPEKTDATQTSCVKFILTTWTQPLGLLELELAAFGRFEVQKVCPSRTEHLITLEMVAGPIEDRHRQKVAAVVVNLARYCHRRVSPCTLDFCSRKDDSGRNIVLAI